MTIYLVRHAKAGSRSRWEGPDDQRPVSKPGRTQAAAIADRLERAGIRRIYTSPYVRCVQTVALLGERLELPLDPSDALAEGAELADAVALIDKVADSDEPSVLCSHGDVIGSLLQHFASTGVRLDGDRLDKGCIWALDVEAGEVIGAKYTAPPA